MKQYFLLLLCISHINLYGMEELTGEIRDIPNELESYHTDRWPQSLVNFYNGMKDVLTTVKENIESIPENIYLALLARDPHSQTIATVRYTETDDICPEEKQYLEKRSLITKAQLEKIYNIKMSPERQPRIGFVFSGGGFRAMLMTLGFLLGAHDIGVLQATTYCAGLSGSTWALAPWIASKRSLQEFTSIVTQSLENGLDHINDPYEMSELFEILVRKILCKQFISSMDFYGAIIVNTLLKPFTQRPLLKTMSESHKHILDGSAPLPIYTAIQSSRDPYEWMEFTPFEIGSSFLHAYVPSWSYGRKFKNGASTNFAPEQTLGYFLGIFGSAFELSIKDIVRFLAENIAEKNYPFPISLSAIIKQSLKLILDSSLGQIRPFPSMAFNFSHNLPNSPIAHEKTIQLIDAGIDFNLPFPPLLRNARQVDVLIVCDSSATVIGAPELRRAEMYARRCGLPFPHINYAIVDKKHISVWYDPNDLSVPLIIYVPRIQNDSFPVDFNPEEAIKDSFCNTFNFAYTKEQARLVCGFTRYLMISEQQTIKDAVAYVLNKKYHYDIPINPDLYPGYARGYYTVYRAEKPC